MSERDQGLGQEDIRDERSEPLPEREVMSLLSGGTASALPGLDGASTAPPSATDGSGAAGSAAESATAAPQQADETATLTGTDADGSATQPEPTVTDQDRSETVSATDTAVAES